MIIPAYRGLAQTRRCIQSVLADPDRPVGRVIVVNDHSPEAQLSAWLDRLAVKGSIQLGAQPAQPGFRCIGEHRHRDRRQPRCSVAEQRHGGTPGMAHAAGGARLCDAARGNGLAIFQQCDDLRVPGIEGGPPAFGLGTAELDAACRAANGGRSVEVPTTVGFWMASGARRWPMSAWLNRSVRPRLRRGKRLLSARRCARLAPSARLRHVRLS